MTTAGISADDRSAWGWFGNAYVQIAVGATLVAASELLLKRGAITSSGATGIAGLFGIGALASGWTWAGIILYVLSFISWLHVLRLLPLSIAFGLINIVHVLVPLGAWALLGETLSMRRMLGIALILIGVVLIAPPVANAEAKL